MRIRLILPTMAIVVALGACSGADDAATVSDAATSSADMAAPEETAAADADGSGDVAAPAADLVSAAVPSDRKIIYQAEVTSVVDDVTEAARAVADAARAQGGFVFSQEITDDSARVTVKVPSTNFDAGYDAIAAIGEVEDQGVQADDVTSNYVDLDARIAALDISIARLRQFLTDATDLVEVTTLERELTQRESERDSLAGQLRVLDDQTTLATISVRLRTPDVEPVVDDDSAGFGDGLSAGVDAAIAGLTAVAVAVGFGLPFLPVLALAFGLVWLVRRRRASGAVGADPQHDDPTDRAVGDPPVMA